MNPPDDASPILKNIKAEHTRMRELLGELHRLLDSRSDLAGTVKAIDAFVVYLRDHFKHEDEGGFFTEITEVAPRLLNRAKQVSQEHVELLTAMETFRDAARGGDQDPSAWWERQTLEFHRLMKELMHHERREQELLQVAYLDDIGIGD